MRLQIYFIHSLTLTYCDNATGYELKRIEKFRLHSTLSYFAQHEHECKYDAHSEQWRYDTMPVVALRTCGAQNGRETYTNSLSHINNMYVMLPHTSYKTLAVVVFGSISFRFKRLSVPQNVTAAKRLPSGNVCSLVVTVGSLTLLFCFDNYIRIGSQKMRSF